MITNIYVDGFNLFNRALKGSPHKWLDPIEVCRQMLRPEHTFNRFRFFTALVHSRPSDPQQPQRQSFYLRAIQTLSDTTIHYGQFKNRIITRPLANVTPLQFVDVLNTEEKGSDVNLATHLLHDAHRKDYECAVVISNDSDLVEPIQIVRRELKLRVLVLTPERSAKHQSRELKKAATFFKAIPAAVLQHSQFPAAMEDVKGRFHKPKQW